MVAVALLAMLSDCSRPLCTAGLGSEIEQQQVISKLERRKLTSGKRFQFSLLSFTISL